MPQFHPISFLAVLSAIGLGSTVLDSCTNQTGHAAQTTPSSLQKPLSSNSTVLPKDKTIPHYEHIFVLIAENKAYDKIIGSSNAPRLNRLAQSYGLATQFYGEVHPSEANYVALLGGSTFGIHDDDAFYCKAASVKPFCSNARKPDYANHTISAPSLMTQLEQRGLTWKGYFEDLPQPGSDAVIAPSPLRALYAAKHNGFMNFESVQQNPNRAQKIVGMAQLANDLKSGQVPNYSHIVLNQCHEMHGLAECPISKDLIRTGDRALAGIVQQIMASSLWATPKNNAIVVTWDEDDRTTKGAQGCCGFEPQSAANFGGGHIATIVMTSHGARRVSDATPYNHYSLLRTVEEAFGIDEHLNHANDTAAGVKSMSPLFASQVASVTPSKRP